MRLFLPARLLLMVPLLGIGATSADDAVTVYRCVDAAGHVTLGDVPCAKGSEEQVRAMQRPQDGVATTPVAASAPAPADAPGPQARVVVVHAPQPMYECVTPDNQRYTSETGDGNPRWVPWTSGYRHGGHGHHPRPDAGRGQFRRADSIWSRVGAPAPERAGISGSHARPSHHARGGYTGGAWIRDTCHVLPQGEVCDRLVDRRDAIRTRFFNAQQRERDALRLEERGINSRLASDCSRA